MIIVFGWRDKLHRRAGGSENVIFTYMEKLKDKVIYFTSKDKGQKRMEKLNNITILRFGLDYLPILISLRFLFKVFRYKPRVLIENINHIPFFIPYRRKIAIIHHLSGKQAIYEFPFLAPFVWFFEYFLLPIFYRRVPIITVSESTKEELKRLGLKLVFVVNNGIDIRYVKLGKKENSIVYIGRIMKYKRVEHIILSFALVKKEVKDAKLYIIGRAKNEKYLRKLEDLVKRLRLKDVYFLGYVSEEEKERILSKSKVVVMTSVREGWGLSVIEGNAFGCVAVGYNVPGLRDSIKDGVNGFLIDNGNIRALAKRIIEVLKDEEMFSRMSKQAIKYMMLLYREG